MEKSRYSKSPSVLIKAPALYVKLHGGADGDGGGGWRRIQEQQEEEEMGEWGAEGAGEGGSGAEFWINIWLRELVLYRDSADLSGLDEGPLIVDSGHVYARRINEAP